MELPPTLDLVITLLEAQLQQRGEGVAASIQFDQIERMLSITKSAQAEMLDLRLARANTLADAARVVAWLRDPNRKRAVHAFTSGPERAICYAVEDALATIQRGIS